MKYLLILTLMVFFHSCSSVKFTGVVDVDDLIEENDHSTGEDKSVKQTDEEILENRPDLKKQILDFKANLIKKERAFHKQIKATKKKKDTQKISNKNKMSRLTNLKDLGVIDITSRLRFNSGEDINGQKRRISKSKYYVVRNNPFDDKFGGKLVCNEEVLILRLDRSKLINCMDKERSKLPFNWKTFLIDYRMVNVMKYERNEIYKKCRLIHAISVSAYHNLSSCLIEDKRKHGLFKYRNVNSFGVNFKLIKGTKK